MESDPEILDAGAVSEASPPPSSTFLSLVEWIGAQGWTYDSSPEHDRVGCTIRMQQCAVRLRCQVYHQDDWRRITVAAVYQSFVPESRRAAVADALARINYSLAVGSFDLDHSDGEVSVKNWHLSEQDMSLEMIDRTMYRALNLADKFHAALMAVAFGGAAPGDVLELANGNDETVQ